VRKLTENLWARAGPKETVDAAALPLALDPEKGYSSKVALLSGYLSPGAHVLIGDEMANTMRCLVRVFLDLSGSKL
jgi:hypothetical protein